MKMLKNHEILKKPIIKKIPHVKKKFFDVFPVLPDACFKKEPKRAKKCQKMPNV